MPEQRLGNTAWCTLLGPWKHTGSLVDLLWALGTRARQCCWHLGGTIAVTVSSATHARLSLRMPQYSSPTQPAAAHTATKDQRGIGRPITSLPPMCEAPNQQCRCPDTHRPQNMSWHAMYSDRLPVRPQQCLDEVTYGTALLGWTYGEAVHCAARGRHPLCLGLGSSMMHRIQRCRLSGLNFTLFDQGRCFQEAAGPVHAWGQHKACMCGLGNCTSGRVCQ
jgi:hypothetical protein